MTPSFEAQSASTERCVICSADTLIDVRAEIDYRLFYVSGVGQLCRLCWRAVAEHDVFDHGCNRPLDVRRTVGLHPAG